jgi:hypothetical protein
MVENFYVTIIVLVVVLVLINSVFKLNNRDKFTALNDSDVLNNILSSDINDLSQQQTFLNPVDLNIDTTRDYIENQGTLNALLNEVNTNNSIQGENPNNTWFQAKMDGPNKAKKYRKISYADSNYRTDFNGDGISAESQNKLDKLYNDAIVFKDSEYQNNSEFKGREETPDNYAPAGLSNFKSSGGNETQKVLDMFNSNNYLPNKNYDNAKLMDGFQILNNPTSVENSNLIPVQKSIGVNTTVGSKRYSSYDLRGDPVSNPKTVISPFNNSSITPDIYSTNRGCL